MILNDIQEFAIIVSVMAFAVFMFTEPLRQAEREDKEEERREQEAYQSKLQQRRFLLDCL